MMELTIVEQHHWLQKFLGEWEYESSCVMEPGAEPMKFSGVEHVRAVGDIWIVGESTGTMPDGVTPVTMMLTLGYNTRTNRFVGTWYGTMCDQLWIYDGQLDEAKRTLTLETEGYMPDNPTKKRKFKESTEFKSDDHRVFTAVMQGDDGKWTTLMTSHYRRVK